MIIAFTGNRGSGKTLSMSREAYIKYKEGYSVYSNFKVNFPFKYYTLKDILEFSNNSQKFKKTIFLLDEAGVVVDSRRSGRGFNTAFSYWVAQTRKKDIDLYYCTQFSRLIDVRLRVHTDMVVQCLSKSIIYKKDMMPYIKINYMPKGDELKVDTYIMNTIIEFSFDGNDKIIKKVFYANDWFNIYDTEEVIRPLHDEDVKVTT